MKKLNFTLLSGLFFSIFTQAQLQVAFVGGGHTSSTIEKNAMAGPDSLNKTYTSRTGFHGGIVADLHLSAKSKLYFQPGVIFYNKGSKYIMQDTAAGITSITTSRFINYIDIPFNLVLKFGKKTKFILGGGPYASFFFSGKEKTETVFGTGDFATDENNDPPVGKKTGQYRIMDYGVNGLVGFDFGKIFLTANYSRGLGNFYSDVNNSQFNHQVIGGTLGIYLDKPVQHETTLKDKDHDGIPDIKDACPAQVGAAITQGCPDKDGDGIADKDDKCPNEKGAVANHGCPILKSDKDGDGIADEKDKCPTVKGLAKYNGCPPTDTDKDGISDEEDKCPALVGSIRYQGCPIPDTDKDGINDEEDKCPTKAGTKENHGCPVIKKEIVQKINFAAKRIQFERAKSNLLPSSYKILDEVANTLKQNPDLKLSIEGHTSNDGIYEENMKLSQQRAEHVKKYLVSKGIAADRLQAKGYGPTMPLSHGTTPEEKALNRRVELKLSNH